MNGKQKIIEAAKAIVSRNGIYGATVREIANEAGMSTGAIYHYYKSKEEILYEIMDDSLSESIRINKMLDKSSTNKDEIVEEIYFNIIKRFEKIDENKIQFYLAEEAIKGDEELKIKFRSKYGKWIGSTEDLISKLYNVENSSQTRALSTLLIGAIDGAVMQILLDSNQSSVKDITDVYHKLLINGIPKLLEIINE